MSDPLHSARQDSLSRHTKVHDNPAKRRRSSAIAPLTPIAPAAPINEQAARATNTEAVVEQAPQYTVDAAPDFFPQTNHYQTTHYQTVVPDAPIDPMLMHDPTVMPIPIQQQQSAPIDPMLNDDMSHFQNFTIPHPEWHAPKNMPQMVQSQEADAWSAPFPQQQPPSAMMANPYYVSDGLSMQNIRDQQRPEWPQQGHGQS